MSFKCKMCARCCQFMVLKYKAKDNEIEWLKLHGIDIYKTDYGDFIKIPLPCLNLKDNKCSNHANRPNLCRDFQCDSEFNKIFL